MSKNVEYFIISSQLKARLSLNHC